MSNIEIWPGPVGLTIDATSAANVVYERQCPVPAELSNPGLFFAGAELPARPFTQPERILAAFEAHGYVCGHALYRAYMPNGRNRIGEMEKDGRLPKLERVPCPNHPGRKHYVIPLDEVSHLW